METRLEKKIEILKETYNSINVSLGDVARELSEKYSEIERLNEEKDRLILEVVSIKSKKNDFDKYVSIRTDELNKWSNSLYEKERELDKDIVEHRSVILSIDKEIDDKKTVMKDILSLLSDKNKEIENINTILLSKEIEKKKFETLLEKKKELISDIQRLEEDRLDSLNSAREEQEEQEIIIRSLVENSNIILRNIEEETNALNRRKESSIKDSKELDKKRRNLSILIKRIEKLYQERNPNYKIKV
jgi:chromosome segregation ATPase